MTDLSKYQPLDDRVLIKPDPQEAMVGTFHVQEENKPKKLIGTVVSVGTGTPLHNLKVNITTDINSNAVNALREIIQEIKQGRPLKVKPGDRVMYGQFAGTRIPIEDEEFLMLRESDVFLIIKP